MIGQAEQARSFLRQFKGDRYVFGLGCMERLGGLIRGLGRRVAVVAGGAGKPWGEAVRQQVLRGLAEAGAELAGEVINGARPNAPRQDVQRIRQSLASQSPDAVVTVGSGSTIDAVKAAVAMACLGDRFPDIEAYFGIGQVSKMAQSAGVPLTPAAAVQLAASSAAHLTKYSNITDLTTGQKKLIVDDAVVPARALFDYSVTTTMPPSFTADGGLDGIAHALEVLYGATGATLDRIRPVALLAIELIVSHLKQACRGEGGPRDASAREALGMGTDLGGYCIMLGSTNGGHLTSFSLVDILPHGRACALMNPYYTVLFAPAIQSQLRDVGAIFARAGYLKADISRLAGRDLGLAVAEAMIRLAGDVGAPTTLSQVPGFTDEHIRRALAAAKNPQLEMKLKAMPVPLSAATVDERMAPVLEAAKTGDFSLI